MKRKAKEPSGIGIVEAVETLSSIADLDVDTSLGLVQQQRLQIQGESAAYRTVHWVSNTEPGESLAIIQETFKVVLKYLKGFYEKEYQTLHKPETIEEIKTIMVLVGEAASKLDKYHTICTKTDVESASKLPEYQKLQQFYHRKISKKIDSGYINRWLQHLPQQADDKISNITLRGRKKVSTKNAFVDLESVKKDKNYELFFIRKEDGTRYFSPKLIRNIKLVHDFEKYFTAETVEDPLEKVALWTDTVFFQTAKSLLKRTKDPLQHFYSKVKRRKSIGLTGELIQKCVIALLLAANKKNLLSKNPVKSCSGYFYDFQNFFRQLISTAEFQHMSIYPPAKSDRYHHAQMDWVFSVARSLYKDSFGMHLLQPLVQEVVEMASIPKKKKGGIKEKIQHSYKSIASSLKGHNEGPLSKVLEMMNRMGEQSFDAIRQENLPGYQFAFVSKDGPIDCLRIPCPTEQEFIHRAKVDPEFIAFLRSSGKDLQERKHLIVNLQDRSSWREQLRSTTIEDLGRHKDFRNQLAVITLAKNSDFYRQKEQFGKIHQSALFKEHLIQQVMDENSGYYFPVMLKKHIVKKWAPEIFDAIHTFFFSDKNVMTRSERMTFIDLFHWMLTLKFIESTKADSFSLTCKDCVDTGQAESVGLYLFSCLITGQNILQKDFEFVENLLFAPALMIRQRNIAPERVERMTAALSVVEKQLTGKGKKAHLQAFSEIFSPLFTSNILESHPERG